MRALLNAGFGDPLPAVELDLIRSLGFDGIRTDVRDPENARQLARYYLDAGVSAIYIVPVHDRNACLRMAAVIGEEAEATPADRRAYSAIEVGNEEDARGKVYATEPRYFGELVTAVESLTPPSVPVVSGGITSLSERALGWLNAAVPEMTPTVVVGYHQYRSRSVHTPKEGFESREEEFSVLHGVADGRKILCTETGYHTARVRSGWCFWGTTHKLSDAEVLASLAMELRYNSTAGALATVLYQLNDGPTHAADDCYGIRRRDGTLKPSSQAVLVAQERGWL